MSESKRYELIYDTRVKAHLKTIDHKYHLLIRKTIEQMLSHEPGIETRNRKPMMRPSVFDATWELRIGLDNRFRVYYKIDEESRNVYILAIGTKIKERLLIGKEVIQI